MDEPSKVIGLDGKQRPAVQMVRTDRERLRQVAAARRARGCSIRDIAAALNVSVGTAHNLIKESRDLSPGYNPERYLNMRHVDRRGVTWRWTDDAWVASSPHFMQMISDQDEENSFGDVVALFGFTDAATSYLRSYEKSDQ
jgi:hypothetical protein